MAKITKTTTLPDSANKTDFYSIVEDATVSDIVNADIKSDAAIADTKLAQITTAGKVSGAALTSLNNIPLGAGDIPKANLDGDWDTDGTLSANSDDKLPTQKAVKTYADTKISKSTAGEINALTEKTTLSDNDIVLIEDSENSYAKKKAKKSNFAVADGSISQAKLKTATGEITHTTDSWGYYTLPGGEYGFYVLCFDTGISPNSKSHYIRILESYNINNSTPTARISCYGGDSTTDILHIRQRYVTASGKDHWIFLLVAKKDYSETDLKGNISLVKKGQLIASYQAPDHPCANQGGATELDIPHPFGSYDPEKHEIVVVDNSILTELKPKLNRRNSLLTLINEQCIIDDTKRPDYEPREIVKINEFPDEPIGQVKARIKTPQWAKIMIQAEEISLEQRIVETLPDYILHKSLWIKK